MALSTPLMFTVAILFLSLELLASGQRGHFLLFAGCYDPLCRSVSIIIQTGPVDQTYTPHTLVLTDKEDKSRWLSELVRRWEDRLRAIPKGKQDLGH